MFLELRSLRDTWLAGQPPISTRAFRPAGKIPARSAKRMPDNHPKPAGEPGFHFAAYPPHLHATPPRRAE